MKKKSNKTSHNAYYARFYERIRCIFMRKKAIPKIDKKVYKRTAASTKAVNLSARVYRGGTRL